MLSRVSIILLPIKPVYSSIVVTYEFTERDFTEFYFSQLLEYIQLEIFFEGRHNEYMWG